MLVYLRSFVLFPFSSDCFGGLSLFASVIICVSWLDLCLPLSRFGYRVCQCGSGLSAGGACGSISLPGVCLPMFLSIFLSVAFVGLHSKQIPAAVHRNESKYRTTKSALVRLVRFVLGGRTSCRVSAWWCVLNGVFTRWIAAAEVDFHSRTQALMYARTERDSHDQAA